ncbi:hypothetical protein BU15DRAFT_73630 [Melanogaster broomeanus]|nr:hypothetical protein BU15DRAFT_73630 [Melanogaster broomeanus]
MPRDLPGLYWDEQRQRYFSLAPSPANTSKHFQSNTTPAHANVVPSDPQLIRLPRDVSSGPYTIRRRQGVTAPHRVFADIRSSTRTAHKDRLIHHIRSSQIALTDKVTRSRVPSMLARGAVTAFQTVCHDGRVWSFTGDSVGWFYSSSIDNEHEDMRWCTHREFNLSSEACKLSNSGSDRVLSIAAGILHLCFWLDVHCYLFWSRLQDAAITARFPSLSVSVFGGRRPVHDIWTADLQGSRLVLGANKQAVVMDGVEDRPTTQYLPTQSDVFALAQHDSILYTGLRNGEILRFDTRVRISKGDALLDGIFAQTSNSITNLKLMRNSQLLVSNVDGRVSDIDVRSTFSHFSDAVDDFTGNINSYIIKAPLAMDQRENILFAAGQDRKIRLWSLRTGGPPLSGGTALTGQTALQQQFEDPVRGMQITAEDAGMCLWAASGTELLKYSLGHHGIGVEGG